MSDKKTNGLNEDFGFNSQEFVKSENQTNNEVPNNGGADNRFNNTNRSETNYKDSQYSGGGNAISKMLGNFGFTYKGNDILDSSLADGKEALTSIVEAKLKDQNIGKFKVIAIEKQDASILYSSLVLAGKINNSNIISYSVLVLTKTGRAELSVKDILSITQRAAGGQNFKYDKRSIDNVARDIAFPIDTYDSSFHEPFVVEKIKQEFNVTNEKISFVNINVFDSDEEFFVETKEGKKPSLAAIEIFKAMFNPIVYADPTLQKQIAEVDFTLVPFITTRTKITHNVEIGTTSPDGKTRSDIRVTLKATFNPGSGGQNEVESINKQPLEKTFIETDIYVTPTYSKRSEFDPSIGRNIEINRVQPVVVISNIKPVENTLKFALGGIIAALPVMSDTMYPYAILKAPNNWGLLSVFETSDSANYSNVLDLKSIDFSEEEVVSLLDSIIAKDKSGHSSAMLAIDISANTKSYGLSIIKDAASEDQALASRAGKAIVKSLHEMTGGRFPLDFDPLRIFQTTTVSPEGYFINKKDGERIPLSTYDITNVIEAKVDPAMVYSFNLCEYNNSRLDAYMNKLDAFEKIGVGSAIVTNKTYRGYFSESLVVELEKAIKSIGLNIYVDRLVARTSISKFEGLTGYNGLSYGYATSAANFGGFNRFNNFDKGVASREWR